MNSRIYLNIYVHHLDADVLVDWGLNLESSTIKLDYITSDGIRMFDSELDIDVFDMLTSFPIESLSESFTNYLGVDVYSGNPIFCYCR